MKLAKLALFGFGLLLPGEALQVGVTFLGHSAAHQVLPALVCGYGSSPAEPPAPEAMPEAPRGFWNVLLHASECEWIRERNQRAQNAAWHQASDDLQKSFRTPGLDGGIVSAPVLSEVVSANSEGVLMRDVTICVTVNCKVSIPDGEAPAATARPLRVDLRGRPNLPPGFQYAG